MANTTTRRRSTTAAEGASNSRTARRFALSANSGAAAFDKDQGLSLTNESPTGGAGLSFSQAKVQSRSSFTDLG
jgi:hypothetical protein